MKNMISSDSLSVLLWSHRLMDGYRLVTPEVRDRDPLRPLQKRNSVSVKHFLHREDGDSDVQCLYKSDIIHQ